LRSLERLSTVRAGMRVPAGKVTCRGAGGGGGAGGAGGSGCGWTAGVGSGAAGSGVRAGAGSSTGLTAGISFCATILSSAGRARRVLCGVAGTLRTFSSVNGEGSASCGGCTATGVGCAAGSAGTGAPATAAATGAAWRLVNHFVNRPPPTAATATSTAT